MEDQAFQAAIQTAIRGRREGLMIIINGMDGAGKGVQVEKLMALLPDAVRLREPGGTPEAEVIRSVLLDVHLQTEERLDALHRIHLAVTPTAAAYLGQAMAELAYNGLTGTAEAYLYAASRAESNQQIVAPARKQGKLIIGERSVACSMAYQGHARGLGMERIWKLNEEALAGQYPDAELFLRVPTEVAQQRLAGRVGKQDRLDLEKEAFHAKTAEGYQRFYTDYCPYRFSWVEASGSEEDTFALLKKALVDCLKK